MDRDLYQTTETARRSLGNGSDHAVHSRRRVLDRLRAAVLAGQSKPMLITGEPGAGKTWLSHQLSCVLPSAWLVARVDVTGAMSALDFLQIAGHSVGAPMSDGIGEARTRLHAILQDDAVDGRRWLLQIDEAHRAAPVVWDEIKALVNQSGRPGGFAAIIVLGDTQLARALATRDFGGVAPRINGHLHLPPLDLDEARELLGFMGHDVELADDVFEELHRDARGNPGGLLRLAENRPVSRRPSGQANGSNREALVAPASFTQRGPHTVVPGNWEESDALTTVQPVSAAQTTTPHLVNTRTETPALIPTKPPIRVEEGLVEVGWDGDLEDESTTTDDYAATSSESVPLDDSSFNEELVEDRYAAIQAWDEWTKVQENATSRGGGTDTSLPRSSSDLRAARSGNEPAEEAQGPSPVGATAGIRAEAEHDFGPYSQLFTRLRQSKQP